MSKKVIKREDFSKFLNTIKLIQEHCTDCEINNGQIRQISNDKHCRFEIDLSQVLPETSMLFTALKLKIMLLKAFELDTTTLPEGADQNIIFESDDKYYRFIDLYSDLKFRIPLQKYLDNTFIPDEDWNKMINTLQEENLIMSTVINSYLSKRVKAITEGFENDVIILKMEDFGGIIASETSNKDNTSDLVRDIELNTKMDKCQVRMVSLPFTLDLNSDVLMDVYKLSKKVVMCRWKVKFFGVPITIYAQSEITAVK